MDSHHSSSTTKSIDVGSMFLMDLSVHESELNSGDSGDIITSSFDKDMVFPVSNHLLLPESTTITYQQQLGENRPTYANQLRSKRSIAYNHRQDSQSDQYLDNSLGRLASAIQIDTDGHHNSNNKEDISERRNINQVTTVEPQPPPEFGEPQSSSLSDESFVASSSGTGDSLSASSYIASSEAEDEERGSTTTREDSGVLDIKDLDDHQLNNSYDNENDDIIGQQSQQRLHQEKPISTTATNLINKSATNSNSDHNNGSAKHANRLNSNNKPTNNNSNNHYHHHNHNQGHHRSLTSKRSVSASLPIEVPARQMKKDLNKSKMNMILSKNLATNNLETTATNKVPLDDQKDSYSSDNKTHDSRFATIGKNVTALDDVDEFLAQEYNENHHNHYPIDEFDEEHLRADENPMKLFESIQALARSLHEDAELFGSLPPKRMLESPIRSLALA